MRNQRHWSGGMAQSVKARLITKNINNLRHQGTSRIEAVMMATEQKTLEASFRSRLYNGAIIKKEEAQVRII